MGRCQERFEQPGGEDFVMMPGACDCHMHFYNARYPAAPTALVTPPDAWIENYREIQEGLGLERVVVVQPTTYGFDNTCQLDAMSAFGDRARGVMVADPSVDDEELARLHRLGVRGIRFHMLPGGVLPWSALETLATRIHTFGWHVQLQFNGRELPDRLAALQRLPGTLAIDHVGRFMPPVAPDDPAFRALLDLLESGRCWVKLSAPYESSTEGPPHFADVAVLARILAKAAPERMLWATNWPHPGQANPLDPAATLDLLTAWVEDPVVRDRILVDNPAVLYGF